MAHRFRNRSSVSGGQDLPTRQLGRRTVIVVTALSVLSRLAIAGPPYVTDDPVPTAYKHYEIYLFGGGTSTRDGTDGAAGIDFNYGATPELQLTAVAPLEFNHLAGGTTVTGLGRVEVAAKYRLLHQGDFGWDVALFPRVILPAGSPDTGERHASLLLPLWFGRDWNRWSTFGGGGCELNRGGDSRDFCIVGWALTRKVSRNLEIGAELTHETADIQGGQASTGLRAGFQYDLNERFHVLGSTGPGIQNANDTNRYSWYAALLFSY
jgi:hypothetical protein